MRPLHLSELDPQRAADELTQIVYVRTRREVQQLGFDFNLPRGGLAGVDPKTLNVATVLAQSTVCKQARVCMDWAKLGKGKPEEVINALRELRASLDGLEPGEASGRELDLTTLTGVMVVAVEARLALVAGRTVEATELATLASLDERSIRASVKAGKLQPVGTMRPMRFAPEVARQYLFERGVHGFVGTPVMTLDAGLGRLPG